MNNNVSKFTCLCQKEELWVANKLITKKPCKNCGRRYKGLQNPQTLKIEAAEVDDNGHLINREEPKSKSRYEIIELIEIIGQLLFWVGLFGFIANPFFLLLWPVSALILVPLMMFMHPKENTYVFTYRNNTHSVEAQDIYYAWEKYRLHIKIQSYFQNMNVYEVVNNTQCEMINI